MKIKRILSMLLCLCMVLAVAPAAFAEGEAGEAAEQTDEMSILNAEELQTIVDDYLASRNIPADNVGIGFCYTATGDEWFMNGDKWVYPGSVYKVPLMMILAEKVNSGEMTLDQILTDTVMTKQEGPYIGGLTLSEVFENIIIRSNNNMAHDIRRYLGGDDAWHTEIQKYARLNESEYAPNYMSFGYFSARFITQVLETLYSDPDRFPYMLECMSEATPNEYLRTNLEGKYTIAQKYGSLEEQNGTVNRHAAGIIYTPNPIVVTVMTVNVSSPNKVIGDIAELLTNYALTLDSKVEIFEQQRLAARVAAEQAAADRAAAEQRAAEEAAKAAAEKAAQEKAAAEKAAKDAEKAAAKEKRQNLLKKVLKACLTVLIICVAVIAAVVILRGKLNKRPAHAPRTPMRSADEDDGEYDVEDWDEEPAPAKIPVRKPAAPVKRPAPERQPQPARRPIQQPTAEKEPAYAAKPVMFMDRFREDEFEDDEYEESEKDATFAPIEPARRTEEIRTAAAEPARRIAYEDEFGEDTGDKFAENDTFLSSFADRLSETGSTLKNKLGSAVPKRTRKRGKHEL